MSDRREGSGMNRRRFLWTLGLASGTLASGALSSSLKGERLLRVGGTGAIRVGLLTPRSTQRPSMGKDFADGLRLGIRESGRGGQLYWHPVGVGESGLAGACRRLLEKDQVEAVVALHNPNSLAGVNRICEEAGKPLFAVHAGAHLLSPQSGAPRAPLSLQLWESAWALGGWSALNLGRSALVAVSFYEGGFDSPEAFRAGFEASGGKTADIRVTDAPGLKGASVDAFLEEVASSRPDLVCAFYSGKSACEFLRRWRESGLSSSIPLVGGAFLTDEAVLREAGAASLGVRTCLPWVPGLAGESNDRFVGTFRGHHRRTPDAFAALGFEAGLLLGAREGAGPFEGPRGPLEADLRDGMYRAPLYLREVRAGIRGPKNEVVVRLSHPDHDDPNLAVLREGIRSGWTNPYLAV